ncbi:MAG: hypothetical protein KDA96_15320 [Planctomycetaceae bacterium]|nr:hypothetical protein [Planctomycetaceae bacterium]
MKEVSEFEAKMLRILRCVMHHASVEQTMSLLVRPSRRPPCLSRNCIELIQDGLSKGVTEWLARSGWTGDRFLQSNQIVFGRLWERHLPDRLALSFSRNSMEILLWLTTQNFSEPKHQIKVDSTTLTCGDSLLMLMTFSALRRTLGGPVLLAQPGFQYHGLIDLMFPDDVGGTLDGTEPSLDAWCQDPDCWVLEALQTRLSLRWFQMERDKRYSSDDTEVRRIGQQQERVLQTLFRAAESTGRKDLCLFLLTTGQHLLQLAPSEKWMGRLDVSGLRMADRVTVYRAALAWFHSVATLSEWNRYAQSVGYYDEDYRASQLWKSEWERRGGDQIERHARRVIDATNPVRTV